MENRCMAGTGSVAAISLNSRPASQETELCAPAFPHASLQRLHWPQCGFTVQADIRNGAGTDACDEKHLGCDGTHCVGEERERVLKRGDRKRIKVPAISTKPENQLN